MLIKSKKKVPSSRAALLSSKNELSFKTQSPSYGTRMATSITSSMIDDIVFKQTRATSSPEIRSSSNSVLGLVTSHQTSHQTYRCKPMLHPQRWSSRARSPHQSSQLDVKARNVPKRDRKDTWISACHEPGHRPCSRRLAHGTGQAFARVHYRLAGPQLGLSQVSSSPSWTTAGLIARSRVNRFKIREVPIIATRCHHMPSTPKLGGMK